MFTSVFTPQNLCHHLGFEPRTSCMSSSVNHYTIRVADTSSCSCGQDDQTPYHHPCPPGLPYTYQEERNQSVARGNGLPKETVGNGSRYKKHCPVHHIHQSKNLDARRTQKKKKKNHYTMMPPTCRSKSVNL
jgi:hypothetical protein